MDFSLIMIMHPFPHIEAAVTEKCCEVAGGSAVKLAEPFLFTVFQECWQADSGSISVADLKSAIRLFELALLAEISWCELAGGSAVKLAEPQTETQFFNYNTNVLSSSETDVN